MRCSRSRERRGGAALALLLALSGCARQPLAAAPAGDPLAVIAARAAQVRTLRAQFDSVARWPGGERRASGVLLVRAPDEWRLRLVAPFGLTVFDALHSSGGSYVTTPLGGGEDSTALAAFTRLGPGDSPVFGAAAVTDCRPAESRDGLLHVWCGDPPTRGLAIDTATATVRGEAQLADGHTLVTRAYDAYQLVDGVPLPYRIRIDYPQQRLSIDIAVSRYQLNPPLADELFAPPPGARAIARAGGGRARGTAAVGRAPGAPTS